MNIPIGEATNNAKQVIIRVVIIEGNKDTFSVVYFKANKEGFICGIPFIKIYPIIIKSIDRVINAENITIPLINLLNLFNYFTFLFSTENNTLINRININNTTPVAINASLCKSAA